MNDQLMILEKMKNTDIQMVSERLTNAFADKFTGKTTINENTINTLIKILWLEEHQVFGMDVYVLKQGEEVVGTFGVSMKQPIRLTVSFMAKVLAAARNLGLKQLLLFTKEALKTNRQPDTHELYIDFIAVKESERNQNIGHRLMEEIIQLKDRYPKIDKLSLYVLKENTRARHLYEKYGFKKQVENEKELYDFMIRR